MKKYLLLFFTFLLYTNQSFSQANCAGALAITPGTQQCGDSAGQAGDFPSDNTAPNNICNSNYNDDEYWFSYTAAVEGENVDLTLSGISMSWAGLFVMDDCPSGTPTCIAQATNSSSTANIVLNTGALTLGQTYRIVISNYGSPNNTAFCLDAVVNPPAAPIDYCGPDAFVDSGGAAGDYPSSANQSWTLCPDVATDKVSVSFTAFAVEDNGSGTCYDELKIYDGDDATATQIGPANGFCYDGTGTNGTGYPGGGLGVPIVSTHSTGCLTFVFTSDGSVQRAGWVADVTCAPYVDPGTAVVLASSGTTTMTADNAVQGSNGYTYYEDPGNPGNYLFAVNWAANGGFNDASNVTITVDNAASDGTADDGGDNATWTMKRFWNVDMGGATLQDPVDVKFFYDPAEKAATELAATNDGRPVETPAWFKTPDGETWDNVPAAGNPVANAIMLTDLNAGAGMTENGITYAEFAGIPAFSGGSFAAGVGTAGASSLPVVLKSFSGTVETTGNELTWNTSSEMNTSHFEVQRLINDNNRWKNIGEVTAAGNSTIEQKYSLLDSQTATYSVYRLKIIDIDGTSEYSQIITLTRTTDQDEIASFYPNPFSNEVNIKMELLGDQNINLQIFDLNGQLVSTKDVISTKGQNLVTVDLSDALSGLYIIRITMNDNVIQKRIVKQ